MEASSSDSLRDHFLLAMPGLDAGLFSGSIAYLCEHGAAGAMGIVIVYPIIHKRHVGSLCLEAGF